ncbi:MAG: hypothetical protein ACQES4_00405 [Bacillota bacterium]
MHSLKVSVKTIISLLFSLNVLLTFLTLSLFGVEASDTVRLIVTEATGLQRDMVILNVDLRPMVIHNVFWLCLASFGFMLIFLFFIDHKFRVFLGPGVLALAITIFMVIVFVFSAEDIVRFVGHSMDLYIQTALNRFRDAAIGMAIFGIILIVLGLKGDQYLKKPGVQ